MTTHIKIKTEENNYTHFDGVVGAGLTLCGLETGGDEGIGIQIAKVVKVKVNCPACIATVKFCQTILKSEIKSE